MIRIASLLLLLIISNVNIRAQVSNPRSQKTAKNIILLIGDGMGVSQIYAAMSVSSKTLNLEQFKVIGFHKTYSANDYITDSGAGGTALSTGVKTCNNCIATDTLGNPLKTILEIAEKNNKATGLISTSSILHATPASFIAHVKSRNNLEDIATWFLKTDIDLFIGGGRKQFICRKDGLNLFDSLLERGYFITDSLHKIQNNKSAKYAVITAYEHNPKYSEGRGDLLPDAAEKAIQILSEKENGFFLMIEGSQIDWGGHDNDINYVVTETIDFDKAIGKALEFAKKDGETLVIVTADHETGGLTLVDGNTDKKITAKFSTDNHTGVMVPVFVYGPGAENFGGIYQNTEVFNKMMDAFGF
ncbi:MAG: hypothetical protein A2X13_01605 [Bacteroidetes bacterium GWC2_33_15]|nr:MAG: hypothetical protein A2X10_08020 [Bacteroidetes bacterium GWA2_33_15]OFX52177.1 MAG: hypothetical protein A2X13_01605 [Bacteroidetes bacterium GWC2_33_15]OFX64331.1 MAG: hypothetical protein A2X15_12425 [Bacteroidetes bacterium GWB2_32_14]OFX67736.1 MAG: hypothetical protein A2X14_06250 [Bacteroidetes bacterium GWD2_33_33]HAN19347.1 alkaline phosphatase [Bacteroidales bacterium]